MRDLHIAQGQLHPPLSVVSSLCHERGLNALLVQVEVKELGPTWGRAAEMNGLTNLERSEGGQNGQYRLPWLRERKSDVSFCKHLLAYIVY